MFSLSLRVTLAAWLRGMATLKRSLIGVCQLNSTGDKERNFAECQALVREGAERGAKFLFLPEAFDYVASSQEQTLSQAETLEGDLIQRYFRMARETGVWMSLGGFHERNPDWERDRRIYNTHILINNLGELAAIYRKTHLFDVDLKGRMAMKESDFTIPGPAIEQPINTPIGKVGLATCYDLRFPEMSLVLSQAGAEILTFPSAFTLITGLAHWEPLLRARAIETQSYVVAAAQTGKHNDKRTSYGHSMVVDPWGCVVAQCHEGRDICYAEIDLDYLRAVRQDMPVRYHRRTDLYGHLNPLPMHTGDH
ncbi:deaminated glutathione amidase isoform X3 [Stegostoma tigrinum]|uniref:deaminated glutathione amidase isoform X3 n=1 Tax=Stegostoma tigrinum TaxID=3053191 RepID=UPI00286FD816|nr:deaminated glutathione amidase isoform X3 [Stegostoma tigrinum]